MATIPAAVARSRSVDVMLLGVHALVVGRERIAGWALGFVGAAVLVAGTLRVSLLC